MRRDSKAIKDLLAEMAAEDREKLADVSVRELISYSRDDLAEDRAARVRELLALDPRCAQWVLELRRAEREEGPSDFEIEREWRSFEANLKPGEEEKPRRQRWLSLAAMLLLVVSAGWLLESQWLGRVTSYTAAFQELEPVGNEVRGAGSGLPQRMLVLKLLLPSTLELGRAVPTEADYQLLRRDELLKSGRLELQDEGDFVLVIDGGDLEPGEYSIRLLPGDSPASEELARYSFQIR